MIDDPELYLNGIKLTDINHFIAVMPVGNIYFAMEIDLFAFIIKFYSKSSIADHILVLMFYSHSVSETGAAGISRHILHIL